MKTILVANKKGGVGKTTCADEIAFALERLGCAVSFANLDPQGGTVHENRASDADADDYQVVDTPGSIDDEKMVELCDHADWVILPTLASMMDLIPLDDSWHIAKLRVKDLERIGVVLNQYDRRVTVDREFEEFVTQTFRFNIIGRVPRTVAIRKAQAQKTSVANVRGDVGAAAAFDAIASHIISVDRGEGVK